MEPDSHLELITCRCSPASVNDRSKRVDDHSRFYKQAGATCWHAGERELRQHTLAISLPQ